jgi:hypothetical protein
MRSGRLVVILTMWLVFGMLVNATGLLSEGSIGWWVCFGIPGGLYALLIFGSIAFSVVALFLALLAPSLSRSS